MFIFHEHIMSPSLSPCSFYFTNTYLSSFYISSSHALAAVFPFLYESSSISELLGTPAWNDWENTLFLENEFNIENQHFLKMWQRLPENLPGPLPASWVGVGYGSGYISKGPFLLWLFPSEVFLPFLRQR